MAKFERSQQQPFRVWFLYLYVYIVFGWVPPILALIGVVETRDIEMNGLTLTLSLTLMYVLTACSSLHQKPNIE